MRLSIFFGLFLILTSSQPASAACTLKQVQTNFLKLYEISQIYRDRLKEAAGLNGQQLSELETKQQILNDGSEKINKRLLLETAQKPHLKPNDAVDSRLCSDYQTLIAENGIEPDMAAAPLKVTNVELEADCSALGLSRRFGSAVRKQRSLAIAGKISRKERVTYVSHTREIRKLMKANRQKSCALLEDYERKLAAE